MAAACWIKVAVMDGPDFSTFEMPASLMQCEIFLLLLPSSYDLALSFYSCRYRFIALASTREVLLGSAATA
jgi:hypothetical protein